MRNQLNMYPKKQSFSLVELMVVIAIIGILATIAIPSYRIYMIKSQIASGVPILNNAIDVAIQGYEANGAFPNILSVYDTSVVAHGYTATLNSPPVVAIYYNKAATSAHVCVHFSNLGIPGYTAPNNYTGEGINGIYSKICMAVLLTGNSYFKACGSFDQQGSDIPVQYLPTGCNCSSVGTVANGSTNCNP